MVEKDPMPTLAKKRCGARCLFFVLSGFPLSLCPSLSPSCPVPPVFIAPQLSARTLPIVSLAAIKRSVRSQQKMPF